MTPSAFAALPLDEQLTHLTARVSEEPPLKLLSLAASIRDWAPLAWLCGELLYRGWLETPAHREQFADFLLARPETAVHRVVRAMLERSEEHPSRTSSLKEALLQMLRVVPIAKISSMCLIDRALKHNFTEARDAHVEHITAETRALLAQGKAHELSTDRLAQLSGKVVNALREVAKGFSQENLEAFDRERAEMAREVITTLNNAPKAISQANAEELLSTRVYTDPGHFLIELLQNAEDAGAKHWRVIFDIDRVIVWHDGDPFDARDLVGVTSIGQTTKRKDQIGFFGVGFKSVYEVTHRPRIYSDAFQFEIADVSVPKYLSNRPEELPQHGTVLILPLKNPEDPQRSPAILHARARALDPCVLFTLRGVDLITIEMTDRVPGGPKRWEAIEQLPGEDGVSAIVQRPGDHVQRYIIQDDVYAYTRQKRDAGRATTTRVMVGLPLDANLSPTPSSPDAATIYSYLPTEEHSGLKFFIQGHFDVPVDRERVNQESDWNRWIVSNVPLQLARALERAVASSTPATARGVGRGVLSVLPLEAEIKSEIFLPLPGEMAKQLATLAMLPTRQGTLRPPGEVLRAPPEICALLEPGATFDLSDIEHRAHDASDTARPVELLDDTLAEREQDVALALGVRELDFDGFTALLVKALAPEGGSARPLARARMGDLDLLARIHDVLLDGFEELDRTNQSLKAISLKKRLRQVALFPDSSGKLHTAASILIPEAGLRTIYKGIRPMIHPDLVQDQHISSEDDLEQGTTIVSRTSALLARLGAIKLTGEQLLKDLEHTIGEGVDNLDGPDAAGLPGTQARLDAIHGFLAASNWSLQRRCAKLPLFRAMDNRLYRMASTKEDHKGALVVEPDFVSLADFYARRRPLVMAGTQDAQGELLERLNAHALDLDVLTSDLQRAGFFARDLETMRALHAQLIASHKQLSERSRATLPTLDIWPDGGGEARVLRGGESSERVCIPSPAEVRAFFPDVPMMHPDLVDLPYAREFGAEVLGVSAVISGFAPDAIAPRKIEHDTAHIDALHDLLLGEDVRLGARSRATLETLVVFLDDRGVPRRLTDLHRASAPLRALYARSTGRSFIDSDSKSMQVVASLGLDARLPQATARTLVEDLWSSREALESAPRDDLPILGEKLPDALAYLNAHHKELGSEDLEHLANTPLFPDSEGNLGELGDWQVGLEEGLVYQFADELAPIFTAANARALSSRAVSAYADLLEATRRAPMTREGMLALLGDLPHYTPSDSQEPHILQRPSALQAIHEWLIASADALQRQLGGKQGALSHVMIWPTRTGSVRCAADLISDASLDALIPAQGDAREMLDKVSPTDSARAVLDALSGLVSMRPVANVAHLLLNAIVREDAPLTAQPAPLDTVEGLAGLIMIAAPEASAERPLPMLSTDGVVRAVKLYASSPQTRDLTEGLPIERALLHPALSFLLDEATLARHSAPFSPAMILDAVSAGHDAIDRIEDHPVLGALARRQSFYQWLTTHEREIFLESECRERLEGGRFFATERGSLLPTRNLVLDPDLPDLGVDWRPSPEIPESIIKMLSRHLGLDNTMALAQLCEEHLLPAYRSAQQSGDRDGAGKIFGYLARRLQDAGKKEVRALIGDQTLLVEDTAGRFCYPDALTFIPFVFHGEIAALWGETAPTPNPARYHDAHRGFLEALGVRRYPDVHDVKALLEREGEERLDEARLPSFARLLALVSERESARLEELDLLRSTRWVLDATGCARLPSEVFIDTLSIRRLIGDFKEDLAHDEVMGSLGEELATRLGLKGVGDVTLEQIKRNAWACEQTGRPIPRAVYQWLEHQMERQVITAEALAQAFDGVRWVYTDDGDHFSHEDVLGGRHLEMFGDRRGYWSQGISNYPNLCKSLAITREPTQAFSRRFLAEIAAEVDLRGEGAVLSRGAIPKMLMANYAFLGQSRHGHQPHETVILCKARAPGQGEDSWHLLPPTHARLLRSDTPELEDLFAESCEFFVARQGSREDQEDVDRYYQRVGLRLMRDAHRVDTDAQSGEDRTDTHMPQIRQLRMLLRALSDVAPRIKLKLGTTLGRWQNEDRLDRLATGAPIKAIDALEVTYRLDGVGEAKADSDAVWDASRKALLVDTRALRAPRERATGLAIGLMPCIYEGFNQDAVVEVVTLLITIGDPERMARHLDRRHYPSVASARSPLDELAARLGEVLDFGLDRRLARRFSELKGKSLDPWRDRDQLAGVMHDGDEDRAAWARHVAPKLFTLLDMDPPEEGLIAAMAEILTAPTLDAIPHDVFDDGTLEEDSDAGWIESTIPAIPSQLDPDASSQPPSEEATADALPRVTVAPGNNQPEEDAGSLTAESMDMELPDAGSAARDTTRVVHYVDNDPEALEEFERLIEESLPADALVPAPQVNTAELSAWGRFKRWLGVDAGSAPEPVAPSWARSGQNPLAPEANIGPQLWVTPEALEAVTQRTPESTIRFEPGKLPTPHMYAPQVLGGRFDMASQSWLPDEATSGDWYAGCRPMGREVIFRGRVVPGMSQLPLPLYSKLSRGPELSSGGGGNLRVQRRSDGTLWVHLEADAPRELSYSVDLLTPPSITGAAEPSPLPEVLLETTVEMRDFPARTRRFIETRRHSALSPWELALATQAFVQSHYVYDSSFMEHHDVMRAKARLRAGVGNHHLELLHASREEDILGRGICYELNIAVAEILRHVGIPSIVASCWVLDKGIIANPDHLFAIALVPGAHGVAMLPLDAAVGSQGPIRPMAPATVPHTELVLDDGGASGALPALPSPGGPWSTNSLQNMPSQKQVERELGELRQQERMALATRQAEARRALLHVLAVTGAPLPPQLSMDLDENTPASPASLERLHEAGALVLGGSPELFAALVAVTRGDYKDVAILPTNVRELVKRDLVRVESRARYHVTVE